jgi:hypothetical protein
MKTHINGLTSSVNRNFHSVPPLRSTDRVGDAKPCSYGAIEHLWLILFLGVARAVEAAPNFAEPLIEISQKRMGIPARHTLDKSARNGQPTKGRPC